MKKRIVTEFNCDNPFLLGSYMEILGKHIPTRKLLKSTRKLLENIFECLINITICIWG